MAFFSDNHGSRFSIDETARTTDRGLNILVVALLAALAFGFWYYGAGTLNLYARNPAPATTSAPATNL